MSASPVSPETVAVVGAGPAGLMAAEALASAGHRVIVYDRMAAPARKFLMAGLSGLNLTHDEPVERFCRRYGPAAERLAPVLDAFTPDALRAWAEGLGQPLFVGSSGRVFPVAMKAAPLLRAWLARLEGLGVQLRLRHRFTGWTADGRLCFETAQGPVTVSAGAVVLALGGASWPRLGSDGGWTAPLSQAGLPITPLRPANAGLTLDWSDTFRARFAGQPLKGVVFSAAGRSTRGEAVVTRYGLEGGAVYPLASALDDRAEPVLTLDLKPDVTEAELARRLAEGRRGETLSNRLRRAARLAPVAIGLMREAGPLPTDPSVLAHRIRSLSLPIAGVQGLERAISTAGGLALAALDDRLMLIDRPGVFCAGEMLDWDAPTGGYLLQMSFATGVVAGRGARDWIATGCGRVNTGSGSKKGWSS